MKENCNVKNERPRVAPGKNSALVLESLPLELAENPIVSKILSKIKGLY
jgi:hypothetical protein